MKLFQRSWSALALVAALLVLETGAAHAQFSQAVVVMKGTVVTEDNARPTAVKVSVRAVNDTAQEITSSRSNSETGKYLVILKPGKKYWIHLEGDTIMTKDIMIETPQGDQTRQMEQDLTVTSREVDQRTLGGSQQSPTPTQTN